MINIYFLTIIITAVSSTIAFFVQHLYKISTNDLWISTLIQIGGTFLGFLLAYKATIKMNDDQKSSEITGLLNAAEFNADFALTNTLVKRKQSVENGYYDGFTYHDVIPHILENGALFNSLSIEFQKYTPLWAANNRGQVEDYNYHCVTVGLQKYCGIWIEYIEANLLCQLQCIEIEKRFQNGEIKEAEANALIKAMFEEYERKFKQLDQKYTEIYEK